MKPVSKQLISFLTASFIWVLSGLTELATAATTVEFPTVTSDNPNVLTVAPNPDGTYLVTVVGLGTANLIVTTPEDVVNGIPPISQSFPFEVYDPTTIATHFHASITDIVEKTPAPATTAETSTSTATSPEPAAGATQATS